MRYLKEPTHAGLLRLLGIPIQKIFAMFILVLSGDPTLAAEARRIDIVNPFFRFDDDEESVGLSLVFMMHKTWSHRLFKSAEAWLSHQVVSQIPGIRLKGIFLAHICIARSSHYIKECVSILETCDLSSEDKTEGSLLRIPLAIGRALGTDRSASLIPLCHIRPSLNICSWNCAAATGEIADMLANFTPSAADSNLLTVDDCIDLMGFSRASTLLPNHLIELSRELGLLDTRAADDRPIGRSTNPQSFARAYGHDWASLCKVIQKAMPASFARDILRPRLIAIIACQLENVLQNWGELTRKKWRSGLCPKIVMRGEWHDFLHAKRRRSSKPKYVST